MSGWQSGQYDPREHQRRAARPPAVPDEFRQQQPQLREQPRFDPQPQRQPQFNPQPQHRYEPLYQQPQAPAVRAARQLVLTTAEGFWYVLMCIGFGAGYFAKIPAKRALQDSGLAQMTAAESFWYVLMCIAFGGGYFAKIPVKKALSEMHSQPGYR